MYNFYINRVPVSRCRVNFLLKRINLIFLMMIPLLLLSASSDAQTITLTKNNATLVEVFKEIRKQTDYDFVYSARQLEHAKKISLSVLKASIKEVLDKCFLEQPFSYAIENKTITIKPKAQSQNTQPLQKNQTITGKITTAATGEALPRAVIKITTTNQTILSTDQGEFTLSLDNGTYNLSISYLSYKTKNITIQIPLKEPLIIALDTDDKNLQEVEIVSTGYQNIPKERATGSFTIIDNKTFNRTVSPDLLSRLKGVTNGLLFNHNDALIIRGRSTIFSDSSPLIVVDNFPFEGDLNLLNPNDIENITILKDAAAASIWGTRAGNGVIVVTTKKGKLNQQATIAFNANLTIGNKPDLYDQQQLSSSEFIDVEKYLFDKGAYTATINNGYAVISPVVALLQKAKLDPAFSTQANVQIDKLRNMDVRDQQSQYFYRESTRQQYHVNINGGSEKQRYFFSGGFDKDLPNMSAQSNSRISLKGNNTYHLLNDKLQLSTDITFTRATSENSLRNYTPLLPYEQIADENGRPLATLRSTLGLRTQYTDTAGKGDLLDWKYRPLDELQKKYSLSTRNLTDYRLNLGLVYKIVNTLDLSLNYQYYKANSETINQDDRESFYARDLINRYSQISNITRAVTRPVPLGDIYNPQNSQIQSNYGRVQLNYNETFKGINEISAIVGAELRDESVLRSANTLFGYNPETATSIPVDLINRYKYYYSTATAVISGKSTQGGSFDRYLSYYANASYSYAGKYLLSGSYRKDESNLFGVEANQKGVPLWSAGLAWNIHKESFFRTDWLSSMQLKASYGYNGNVNTSISAYLTASPAPASQTNTYGMNFYNIVNPPNDNLRWERVQNVNFGVFFSTKHNIISGSLEYYSKKGKDLIASSPIAPQTGITLFTGNSADTHTKGIDIQISSSNLNKGFKWNTITIFNYAKDKITDYKVAAGSNGILAGGSTISPMIGYPIAPVFALKWAGLDATGNPQGYLDGEKSIDYTSIQNATDRNQLEFFGSQTPLFFGSLRNTFQYKLIELSFNLTYKFDYFFRASSLTYYSLFSAGGQIGNYQQRDYALRWQKPGDELITTVPSAVYPNNNSRDTFYANAAVNIQRGDHIRLQDIQLNVSLTKKEIKRLPFANLNIYCYTTNLGILWRKNKKALDPDNFLSTYLPPRTIAFGIKTNL